MHEKPYDAIVVKEILGRADVGRSTFYAHFRDKDELLDRALRDTLRACETNTPTRSSGPADRILRFSLPLFLHIEEMRSGGGDDTAAAVGAREQSAVHERLELVIAERIADELRRLGRRPPQDRDAVPGDLLARHVASTFVLVLNWWMECGERTPAKTANDLFRALVGPAVAEVLGPVTGVPPR